MNKKTAYLLVLAALAITAVLWLWMKPQVSNAPDSQGSDTTESINKDLNTLSVESADFQSIDADVNSL